MTLLDELSIWFSEYSILAIGIVLAVIGLVLTLSELKQVLKHDSTSDQLIFWLMVLLAGLVTIALQDLILGLLAVVVLVNILNKKYLL